MTDVRDERPAEKIHTQKKIKAASSSNHRPENKSPFHLRDARWVHHWVVGRFVLFFCCCCWYEAEALNDWLLVLSKLRLPGSSQWASSISCPFSSLPRWCRWTGPRPKSDRGFGFDSIESIGDVSGRIRTAVDVFDRVPSDGIDYAAPARRRRRCRRRQKTKNKERERVKTCRQNFSLAGRRGKTMNMERPPSQTSSTGRPSGSHAPFDRHVSRTNRITSSLIALKKTTFLVFLFCCCWSLLYWLTCSDFLFESTFFIGLISFYNVLFLF